VLPPALPDVDRHMPRGSCSPSSSPSRSWSSSTAAVHTRSIGADTFLLEHPTKGGLQKFPVNPEIGVSELHFEPLARDALRLCPRSQLHRRQGLCQRRTVRCGQAESHKSTGSNNVLAVLRANVGASDRVSRGSDSDRARLFSGTSDK
jgi:hypothetical protein